MGHRNQFTRMISVGIALMAAMPLRTHAHDDIETAGDVLLFAMPATAAGLTIKYSDGQGALQFGEATALTLGVTYGLKYALHKVRPDGGSLSFPSGHTSMSFCTAEFLRRRYGWEAGLPAYAAASFVGYSRVEAGKHYPVDVAAGAAIGILSSHVLVRPFKGWSLQPVADSRGYGVQLVKGW